MLAVVDLAILREKIGAKVDHSTKGWCVEELRVGRHEKVGQLGCPWRVHNAKSNQEQHSG